MKRLALILALLSSPVDGHETVSGWKYSSWCCSGKDCAPIPLRAVKVMANGYLVTLQRGDHPLAGAGVQTFLPFDDKGIQPSGDLEFHACIVGGKVRCLYVAFSG